MNDLPKDMSVYVFGQPSIEYMPLVILLMGLGQYVYRKYLFPLSDETIRELNRQSFLGITGAGENPRVGMIVAIMGIILFVILNIPYIQFILSQI